MITKDHICLNKAAAKSWEIIAIISWTSIGWTGIFGIAENSLTDESCITQKIVFDWQSHRNDCQLCNYEIWITLGQVHWSKKKKVKETSEKLDALKNKKSCTLSDVSEVRKMLFS